MLGYAVADLVGRDQPAIIHHSRADGTRFPEVECPHYIAREAGVSSHLATDVFWHADGTPITVTQLNC